MNSVLIITALISSIITANDPCSHKDVKKDFNGDIHDFFQARCNKFSASDVKGLGSKTAICSKLDASDIACIAGRIGSSKLIHTLNYKCLKALAKGQADQFESIFGDIKGDEKQIKNFLNRHKDVICEDKAVYKPFDELYKQLVDFCKDKKVKNEKEQLQKDHDELKKKVEEGKKKDGKKSAAEMSALVGLSSVALMFGLSIFFAVML